MTINARLRSLEKKLRPDKNQMIENLLNELGKCREDFDKYSKEERLKADMDDPIMRKMVIISYNLCELDSKYKQTFENLSNSYDDIIKLVNKKGVNNGECISKK